MGRPPKNGWSKDKKYWNGKPVEHWEKMAKKNIVDHLVRGSYQYFDENCLPRELASKTLMSMALSVDRNLVADVLAEREQFRNGMAMTIASALMSDEGYKKLKQAMKRSRTPRR